MTRAFSYTRFSTPEQGKGDSIRRQLDAARRYAAQNGLELDEELTFTDPGVSAYHGKNADGGALAAFLNAVEAGVIPTGSYLLVESLDRISRQKVRRAVRTMEMIVEAGIILVDLSDGGRLYSAEAMDNDQFSYIMMVLRFMRANEESALKSRRVRGARNAARAAIRAGTRGVLTSRCPAWLRMKDDRSGFEVIEARAEVVRRIFTMIAAGRGKHGIAETFNGEGIPTWGDPSRAPAQHWHSSYIHKIAGNAAVIGTFTPYIIEDVGHTTKRMAQPPVLGYFPAVVEEELFRRVQAIQIDAAAPLRGRHAKSGTVRNLLGGLAKCPQCASTMTRVTKGATVKAGKPYLVCSRAKAGGGCTYRAVHLAGVEAAIRDGVDVLVGECPMPGEAGSALDDQIRGLENEVGAINDEIGRLIDALRLGGSPTLSQTVRQLETTKEKLQKDLEPLWDKRAATFPLLLNHRVAELESTLSADPFDCAVANARLRECFSEVVVDYDTGFLEFTWKHGGASSLRYSFPIPEDERKGRRAGRGAPKA